MSDEKKSVNRLTREMWSKLLIANLPKKAELQAEFDGGMNVSGFAEKLGIPHNTAQDLMDALGLKKVASGVPQVSRSRFEAVKAQLDMLTLALSKVIIVLGDDPKLKEATELIAPFMKREGGQ